MKKKRLVTCAAALLFAGVLYCAFPSKMEVSIKGNLYENRDVPENRISVYVGSAAGIELPYFEDGAEISMHNDGNKVDVKASCGILSARTSKAIIPVRNVDVEYCTKAYPGDRFRPEFLHVWTEFADGIREESDNYSITESPGKFTKDKTSICVSTKDGPGETDITPVKVTNVTAKAKEKLYQYDKLDVSEIVISYEDGWQMYLSKDDVKFDIDTEKPLEKLGKQTVGFSFEGVKYDFEIETLENTNVSNAVRENAEELENAEHTYVSDNCYIAVTKHVDSLGTYYISHVVVNDPSQIHADLSYGDWGGKREKPSDAADRLGLVLATNASYFSYDTNAPRCTDVVIKNGKIESNGETDGQEICLKEDGTLFTPKEKLTGEDLLKMDVVESWAAGDPLLIQNGNLYPTHHDWVNGKYPRTGIGMVKPCEYYVLTAGSGGYKGGLTFDDVQDIFKELGCQYARTLDGGGSSTLAVDCTGEGAEVINNPAGGSERAVVDIFGVSDVTG
jgi:exopolysaccharide biosynthesis protein